MTDLRPHGCDEPDHGPGPRTFPGADWYQPEQLPAAPSASTLPMTREELKQAREREARPFGFAAALEDEDE